VCLDNLYCFCSTPFQETSEPTLAVPNEQQPSASYTYRVSLLNVKQNQSINESDVNDDNDKILSKSLEYISPKIGTEIPVLVTCKDAIYHDSPSSNENINAHPE
jgi:hypothetical protein